MQNENKDINGIINIYKEKDYTSFDVVARLRGIFKQKKIGHTGTLDPQATGVLPVCLGKATKLCDSIAAAGKEYEAIMYFGMNSDTLDIYGEIKENESCIVSKKGLEAAIKNYEGGYDQTPPMYSAKKIRGKRLYELARQGIEVERKPCFVEITEIAVMDFWEEDCFGKKRSAAKLRIACGKGTYVRSLIADIGSTMNVSAVMGDLVRMRVGDYHIENAVTIDAVQNYVNLGNMEKAVTLLD